MFGTIKNTINNDIETVVGKNTVIQGEIKGDGNIRIDGAVEGNITISGNVIVGESGLVKGDITANDMALSGHVEGDVVIEKKLHIFSTGQLSGDIKVGSLQIDDGGIFNGHSEMSGRKLEPAFAD